jgi:hypothetical protein
MDSRIDPHGNFVGILSSDFLIHVEEVAVFFANHGLGKPANRIREVQINALPAGAHASPFIADFLRIARSNVAGNQIAEARVTPFEVIIPLVFRNAGGSAIVVLLLRHPHAPVVS